MPSEPKTSELVRTYAKRLSAAAKNDEKSFTKRADRMARYYEIDHYMSDGDPTQAGLSSEDRIKVAYPYANARQILAEIYPQTLPEPLVKCESKELDIEKYFDQSPVMGLLAQNAVDEGMHDPVESSKNMKSAIKYCIRKSNLEREAKMAVLDGIVTGFGCIMQQVQKTTKVPRYERIMWRDVLFASNEVTDPYQSPWVARKLVRPLKDIHEDATYNSNRSRVNTAKVDPKSASTGDELEYGVLWDLYDKKDDLHVIFPDGQDFELFKGKLTDEYPFEVVSDDFVCDWPFDFYVNEEMLTSPRGLGDIFPIESQVRELDKTRSQQINHRKRFNRKYLTRKDVVDQAAKNQLKNPEDGTLIELTTTGPLEGAIVPLSDAPMSPDVYRVEAAIKEDMQAIQPIGPNSLVRGTGDGPDTLGEAQIIEGNANTRLAEKQKTVARMLSKVYRHTGQHIQFYWRESESLLVQGDGSKPTDWMDFTPQKIMGEFAYEVAPESMRDNTAVYRKQISEAISTLVPLLPLLQQDPGMNLLARRYLETFDTLSEDVDTIVPEIQPVAPADGEANSMLLDEITNGDPDEFIDKVNGLPQNERDAIVKQIGRLRQQGAPTGPGIAQGASQVQV